MTTDPVPLAEDARAPSRRRRRWSPHRGERALLLAVGDGAVAGAVALAALWMLPAGEPLGRIAPYVFVAFSLAVNYIAGLFEPEYSYWRTRLLSELGLCAAVATALTAGTVLLLGWPFPLETLAVYVLGTPVLSLIVRQGVGRITTWRGFSRSVVVYGCGVRATGVVDFIRGNPAWGLRLLGCIDTGPESETSDVENESGTSRDREGTGGSELSDPLADARGSFANGSLAVDEAPPDLLGVDDQAVSICERLLPDYLVIACERALSEGEEQRLLACAQMGVRVLRERAMVEKFARVIPLEWVSPDATLQSLEDDKRVYAVAKRVVDVAFALIGVVITVAFLPMIAAGILVTMGWPVFYVQRRVGENGREFRMFKFRTMVKTAEADGPRWASRGDARVTPLGRLLRATRLDELPQFANVLLGDMSLVGPRPERPEFVRVLTEAIPFYELRYLIRPGISGWAQVNLSRAAQSVADAQHKLEFDLYYVRHRSLLLDMAILLRTIAVCLAGRFIRRGQPWTGETDDAEDEATADSSATERRGA